VLHRHIEGSSDTIAQARKTTRSELFGDVLFFHDVAAVMAP
jgi:hypothetical protein